MPLEIINANIDGVTSHVVLRIRAVEVDSKGQATYGPPEDVGIDNGSLISRYHGAGERTPASLKGAFEKWLAENHARMLERKHAHEQTAELVEKLKGEILFKPAVPAPEPVGAA